VTTLLAGIDFVLPDALSAHEPPETRGITRDEVKLMVSRTSDDGITNTCFFRLPYLFKRGDVLVVNTSATINAAFVAVREAKDGRKSRVTLHLSTPVDEGRWVVEVRRNSEKGTSPLLDAERGELLYLPGGAIARLVEPCLPQEFFGGGVRLWIAELTLPRDVLSYSAEYGSPIRYQYVPKEWPLEYYQTVFSVEPGSAEMPSAGRAFTREIVDQLKQRGVTIAPILLHTGVSSQESDEPPYPEFYRVPVATANAVNQAHERGNRVVAVGTTVVRALETVASPDGIVSAGEGWTDLIITRERGVFALDGILTGLHAPRASHLTMLEAFASADHLSLAYENALREEYLWHEFGDLHLILP
jgi:S-adenosylmethionine:tRNA ribosyltransferase-isomerase